jgi:MFS family permease
MKANGLYGVFALAGIYSLRMLGLFMILPVFALYAENLSGTTPLLTGLALGGYGLTMALLQIPFGTMSDHFGRKPVIAAGLLLFVLGSAVAAMSDSVTGVIAGRLLQGSGAIAAAVMALIADFTDESERTKSMAVFGMSIGASFTLALILGPLLDAYIGVDGLFWLASVFGVLGIVILYLWVPNPQHSSKHSDVEAQPMKLKQILADRQLLRLDVGIFCMHTMMTATFIALPFALRNDFHLSTSSHVWFYLPILLASVAGMIPLIIVAEKYGRMKQIFTTCVAALLVAEIVMSVTHHVMAGLVVGMFIYFVAFNVLEASLPSLVSRLAPAAGKGTAMGVYSTCQFFGVFCGGIFGGMMYDAFGVNGVFMLSAAVALVWLLLCRGMRFPMNMTREMIFIAKLSPAEIDRLVGKIRLLDGVEEVSMIAEESMIYMKVDKTRYQPDAMAGLLKPDFS